MPTTTLTIPTLVRPDKVNGEDVYHVRSVFFDNPIASHRRYSEAIKLYKGVIKRRFSGFTLSRSNVEQLLWFKFGQPLTLTPLHLEFSIGSHFVRGLFNVASFEWQGLTYACLPSLGEFMYIVPKNEKGKPELKETTEKNVKTVLQQVKKIEGSTFDASRYFSVKREFLTTVQMEVTVKDPDFAFELSDLQNFFASFRQETNFDGADEIEKVGTDLCEKYPEELRRAFYQDPTVQQVSDLVFKRGNTPVVLVGPEGVGKHTIMEEVAFRYMGGLDRTKEEWRRHNIWHINPNRIIAGMSLVGQWEKRFEAILKYVMRPTGRHQFPDKILIDNPVALLRIGKAAQSDLSLSKVLKPYLEQRKLQLVLLATPEEWKIVQETDRGFSDLFQVVRVPEPDMATAVSIVLQNRRSLELRNTCTISVPAISQLFTLQRNYLKHKALPGSVMKLLTQLTTKYSRQAIDAPQVREEFKSFSGLQERIFDEQEKLDELDMQEALAQELVGQPAAVAALANAIHLVKAKLTDRNRPLASFLFIGPTGVGKTHAAKLLCKTMLGSEDHLLRFDMNEYIDAGALHRLIGDSSNPEGQLTGKVRYRPFSVVLLDEIEKAHPNIHDLLLQMLDDARLTDSLGRTVDFSNTIIVMTSNLGAREAASQIGYQSENRDEGALYRKAVELAFRPELVNRIEQIVIFNPLTFSEIQKIAQLQIRELLQRDGFVRRTTIVNVSPEALDWVARRGFDARMGGRALKRQIERDLTLLSAEQLIRTTSDTPLILDIFFENDRLVPNITPLEFAMPMNASWLPEIPKEEEAARFFKKLLLKIEGIEREIASFEQRQERKGHLLDVGGAGADWKHYDFKNKVLELKEATQLKQLRQRERRHTMVPAIPFRLKRVSTQETYESSKASKETLRDRLFQERGLEELREMFTLLSPEFDSSQTDYLISFLDLAILERMMEGFLRSQTDKVTLQIRSCVTNTGQEEVDFLANQYIQLFKKLDIPHSLSPDLSNITAEEHRLRLLLNGEEGIHLFYRSNNAPVPVRLTLLPKIGESAPVKVIRIYDGTSSLADLRSGYTNNAFMTPDELKLLLYAGFVNSTDA